MPVIAEMHCIVHGVGFDVTYSYSPTDDRYLEITSAKPDGCDTDWIEYIEESKELFNELWEQVVRNRTEIVQTGGIDPLDYYKRRQYGSRVV